MQDNLILLPHDPDILIQDLSQKNNYLTLMRNVLKHCLIAIHQFQQNNLKHFDAQVGDTLCQIRAYKIYCLSIHESDNLSLELNELQARLHQIIPMMEAHQAEYTRYLATPKKQRPDWIRASITLKELFIQCDSIFPLSHDALFIVLSHFLCHFQNIDEEAIPISLDIQQIASKWNISLGYAKKLTHYYQKMLANASCSFIFQLLFELPQLNQLQRIFPLLHRTGDEGRMVLPCHAVTEIIICHMIQSEAYAVLLMKIKTAKKSKSMMFHLKGNSHANEFERIKDSFFSDNPPCIVFYGVAEPEDIPSFQWMNQRIHQIGFSQFVLMNNAAHPQYSGSALAAFQKNPYTAILAEDKTLSTTEKALLISFSQRLKTLQIKAQIEGLTQTNASLFFLKHIFCSTMEKYLPSHQKIQSETSVEYRSPDHESLQNLPCK